MTETTNDDPAVKAISHIWYDCATLILESMRDALRELRGGSVDVAPELIPGLDVVIHTFTGVINDINRIGDTVSGQ